MGLFDDVHKLGAVAGFIVLAHACYVTISYRNDLKIEGVDFTSVPFAVVIECVIGAAACAWGALGFAGEFLPIKAQPRELPPVTMERMNDFMIFAHRGKALAPPGGKGR